MSCGEIPDGVGTVTPGVYSDVRKEVGAHRLTGMTTRKHGDGSSGSEQKRTAKVGANSRQDRKRQVVELGTEKPSRVDVIYGWTNPVLSLTSGVPD